MVVSAKQTVHRKIERGCSEGSPASLLLQAKSHRRLNHKYSHGCVCTQRYAIRLTHLFRRADTEHDRRPCRDSKKCDGRVALPYILLQVDPPSTRGCPHTLRVVIVASTTKQGAGGFHSVKCERPVPENSSVGKPITCDAQQRSLLPVQWHCFNASLSS